MKKFIVYSKQINLKNNIIVSITKNSNHIFAGTLIIAGLIIGTSAILLSAELRNIVSGQYFSENSDLSRIINFSIIGVVFVFAFYILTGFSCFGGVLIPIIPFIFGVASGINITIFLINADIEDICVYILFKLPSVALMSMTILYLSVMSFNVSDKVFRTVLLSQKYKIDFRIIIINIIKILPLSFLSVILEIIYWAVQQKT